MNKKRVLFVDDSEDLRELGEAGLEKLGFEVIVAGTVNDALRLISVQKFDVLITDLHIPDAGDGFTVVSAMRHANPNAVTLVLSGYPDVQEAMNVIRLQADEVLMKPISTAKIAEVIQKKLLKPAARGSVPKDTVATILKRDKDATISKWLWKVEEDPELRCIGLHRQERTGHLPLIFEDLIRRLRLGPAPSAVDSLAASNHGVLRRRQGYTVAMMVEESRILQVCIFNTLQNNLGSVDFESVLVDVMTIADEVDSQLKQAVLGFMEAPVIPLMPDLNGVIPS
jgi:CheY-like chemotaxis protein